MALKKKKLDLGFSFADSILGQESRLKLATKSRLRTSESWGKDLDEEFDNTKVSSWRLVPLYICIALIIIFLAARAFTLQVINGASFRSQSEGNHVFVQVDHAPRGVIYDRNGTVLVRNKPGFRIAIRPIDLPDNWEKVMVEIAPKLSKKPEDLIKLVKETKTESVTLANNLTNEAVIDLRAQAATYPWLSIEIDPKREYIYGSALAAILGYTSEANVDDLQTTQTTPYSAGDQVGKAGVEASFEKQLRGANGYGLVKVDSQGKSQGSLFQTDPAAGSDVTLSIDLDLQKMVYETLSGILTNKGGEGAAAVVSDVKTGEILALASVPTYDDNFFAKPIENSDYQKLINDPGHLLLNRAISATYPPGSTFKLVVSAAGLETGTISKTTKITDTGYIQLGDVIFNNWLWLSNHRTEGDISVVRAIARSNDTFFYRLGQMLGPEKLAQYARSFGLGKKTGIDLPGELPGQVPDSAWKEKVFNQVWFPGESLNYGIGQGYLLVSPIQLNAITTVVANGGTVLKPQLIHNASVQKTNSNFLSADTLETLREGMYENTVGDGNVSYLFKNFPIKSGGKTGTAESGGEAKPHAWYTGYAPYDNPQIAVTVMVERVGHGSEVSAPAVKKIFEWWFARHPIK